MLLNGMLLNGRFNFQGRRPRNLLFTGKGGVGKTSLACATAVALADSGCRVLLVSTDPASNLDEVLDARLSTVPRPISAAPGLTALNIDPIEAARLYRERVLAPYRGVLPAEAVANIEEQLSGGCTVEIAAFSEFARLLGDAAATADYDHVIFDTAPGGHTLRLLSLPAAWSSFVGASSTGVSCLGPLAGLQSQRALFDATLAALTDPAATQVVLVARPQKLALAEAHRLHGELAAMGLTNQHLVINGMFPAQVSFDPLAVALAAQEKQVVRDMPAAIAVLPRTMLPLRAQGPLGIPALRQFLSTSVVAPPRRSPPQPLVADAFGNLEDLVDQLAPPGHGIVMTMGKGGVGKTTIAALIAKALAERGHRVHLTTTGPRDHLAELECDEASGVSVGTIDPQVETAEYRARIMADIGSQLDEDARALLIEDLQSPCTEEMALFQAFARQVARGDDGFLVFDSAPTGHTLLLIDAALAYHREVARQIGDLPPDVRELLPRLRDPAYARVLLVTLPEATPIHEAALLQDDLARAGITPFAWVVNQCLAPHALRDPLLIARREEELSRLNEIARCKQGRGVLVAWQSPAKPTATKQRV